MRARVQAVLTVLVLSFASPTQAATSVAPVDITYASADPKLTLAARELRRYLYILTGELAEISNGDVAPVPGHRQIVVGSRDQSAVQVLAARQGLGPALAALVPDGFLIKSEKDGGTLLIAGQSPEGALYGAYRLLTKLGIRFEVDGDVIPDGGSHPIELSGFDETGSPLFPIRGLLPFHDFAEGPDWWDQDNYLEVIHQLPKQGLNFFGLHTYPGVEPTVWIGQASSLDATGSPVDPYTAAYFNTARAAWGHTPKRTSDFNYGASQLFERDSFSSSLMQGLEPYPKGQAERKTLFDRVAALLNRVFTDARGLGIRTAAGLETPIRDPMGSPADAEALYQGVFTRLLATYPLDYFWIWTPESWTWDGNTPDQFETAIQDLETADSTAKSLHAPFQVAVSGWVLGPANDRALFDRRLPREIPLSALNQDVGFRPIDTSFQSVTRAAKWAIPWLEDDPALTIPQLWVKRLRADVASALGAGIEGLIGIHWRTHMMGPVIGALARDSWQFSTGGGAGGRTRERTGKKGALDVESYYTDWARAEFGENVAAPIAEIFARIDSDLPRPTEWTDGPGGVLPEKPIQLKECTRFGPPALSLNGEATCPPGEGFSLVHRQVSVGGYGVGTPIVAALADRIVIAVPGPESRVQVREWNIFPYSDWYTLRDSETSGEIKFVPDSEGLWLYRRAPDGRTYRSLRKPGASGPDAWGDWQALAASAEFGEVGPHSVQTPFGTYQVSNPSFENQYSFVDELASVEGQIIGAGHRERFEYWLNSFLYMRELARLQIMARDFDYELHGERRVARLQRLRAGVIGSLGRVYGYLLKTVRTTGELGTIANWEEHILPTLIDAPGMQLELLTGHALPPGSLPTPDYAGEPRLIVTSARSNLGAGESYTVKAIILGPRPSLFNLGWAPLGAKGFRTVAFQPVGRGVYTASIPAGEISGDFEYRVDAKSGTRNLVYPPSAGELGPNQTVVLDPTVRAPARAH